MTDMTREIERMFGTIGELGANFLSSAFNSAATAMTANIKRSPAKPSAKSAKISPK